MYPLEQFIELSPPEAHSEDVLSNEHQLMLNRLGFELVERQRFREFSSAAHILMPTFARPPDLTEGPKSSHKKKKTYSRPQNPKLPRPKV